MAIRPRTLLAPLAAVLLSAAPLAAPARADQAYDKVATAFAQSGGHLDPCAFTQAELEAGLRGIPPAIRNVVPALRRAMEEGIAAHQRGDCRGVRPAEEGTTGGAAPGAATTTAPTTPPPVVTTPPQTQTAPVAPATTTPPPTGTEPAPAATTPAQPAAQSAPREHDRTLLLVALVAVGALMLLALLLWGLARLRGWDPPWAARMRHGWSEAGFRTTSTWSEFTDWLRLGR